MPWKTDGHPRSMSAKLDKSQLRRIKSNGRAFLMARPIGAVQQKCEGRQLAPPRI
jgi:hypothetical protein